MCWRELDLDLDAINSDLRDSIVVHNPLRDPEWRELYGQTWLDTVLLSSPYRLSDEELADYLTLREVVVPPVCTQPERDHCETVAGYGECCDPVRGTRLERSLKGLRRGRS